MSGAFPTLDVEKRLWSAGYRAVAGIDEVGRGALAGPVVAGAVILPVHVASDSEWHNLRDSKQLTPSQRVTYARWIEDNAVAWAIGESSPSLIDKINIAEATKAAMRQAIGKLSPLPDYLLIDWVKLPSVQLPQETPAKADSHIISVAAASIIAKVYRDNLLVELDKAYPEYEFARNKGYGTQRHRTAIADVGPSPVHRYSFAPIANLNYQQ